jgi:hypothetical protein
MDSIDIYPRADNMAVNSFLVISMDAFPHLLHHWMLIVP